ncbi:hypothetical protein BMT55_15670 [Listeria newyorkensis]|uniref:Uncharacterized protein n=1 Tax=Listeria newyorkensis TaxID=1497681 RepID=A0ABX4XI87_9LIST|nr:hypothetical protein [Listeria newyorkensis]PNP88200.1 hypothetical protein BMT55_15670 [Listeria newyorkensis]
MGDERKVYTSQAEYDRAKRLEVWKKDQKAQRRKSYIDQLSRFQVKPISFYEAMDYEEIEKLYKDLVVPHQQRKDKIKKNVESISRFISLPFILMWETILFIFPVLFWFFVAFWIWFYFIK